MTIGNKTLSIFFIFSFFFFGRVNGQEIKMEFDYLLDRHDANVQEFKLNSCCIDFPPIKKYCDNLDSLLNKHLSEDYDIRFIAMPSFDPEYAFQMKIIDNLHSEIQAVVLHKNLWYFKGTDSMKVNLFKRDVDNELALQIDKLFFLLTTSFRNEFNVAGCDDGITYNLYKQTVNCIKCGEIHCLSTNSILGETVSICDKIMDYAIGKNVDLSDIINRIDELIMKLE